MYPSVLGEALVLLPPLGLCPHHKFVSPGGRALPMSGRGPHALLTQACWTRVTTEEPGEIGLELGSEESPD